MTNREKFAEQILDIACEGDMVTIKDGNLCACNNVPCMKCDICFSFDLDDTTDCRERFKKWCESEYIEKPKISESDRRFLDYLSKDYKWIARDEDNRLYAFKGNKPFKCNYHWIHEETKNTCLNIMFEISFPMVKWEDEEPWSIEDLKKLEVEE